MHAPNQVIIQPIQQERLLKLLKTLGGEPSRDKTREERNMAGD